MPAKILIVDDATALRTVLRALLRSEGHNVVGELASGSGVLEAVGKLRPDIVCLDYQLPDASGLDLLKALHAAHPQVAVVMITGSDNPQLEAEAAEAGAAGFIRKPFTQDRIVEEIRLVEQTRELLRRHQEKGGFGLQAARANAVIADDSASMRLLLASILNHAGIYVAGEASDGQQAIDQARRSQPDLVCLDMDMPVLTGLEALAQIKADCPKARILMITGRAGRDLVLQAARLGASGYILKPFDPDKVIEAIQKLLGLPPLAQPADPTSPAQP